MSSGTTCARSMASCSGGACHFLSTETTLKDGFCSGGVCHVDGEVTSSRLKDALAY